MLRMLLVLFAYAVGITVSLPNAVYASCFFIWSDIFRPPAWARYHGILHPDIFYPVHICTGVLAFSIIFCKWKHRWNLGATVILVSLGWFFISALCAEYRDIAIGKTLIIAKYFIPLAFISATLCTRNAQRLFIYTLAASVGVWMAHHGLLALIKNRPITDMAIPRGQMTDRNDFLVAGTACVPLMLYAAFHYQGRWQKAIRGGILLGSAFAIIAVVYSLSRGAMVGFALLLMWYSFLTGRFFRRIAVGGIIAIVALACMPQFVWERLSTIETEGEQTESSARHRVEHMVVAIRVTLDYPLTGVGADNFPIVSNRHSVFSAEPHSLWLKCSSEYGMPMLVFFVLLVFLFLSRLRQRAKLARALGDRGGEALATTLSCALVGFLATGTFTSQFVSEYMWSIIGLIGAFLATPLETPVVAPAPVEPVPAEAAQRAA